MVAIPHPPRLDCFKFSSPGELEQLAFFLMTRRTLLFEQELLTYGSLEQSFDLSLV